MSPRKVTPRERGEQHGILKLLNAIGARAWVLGTTRRRGDHQGTMQTPGLPDVIAFLPPKGLDGWRMVIIEAKAPGGRLRPEQAVFRDLCLFAGVAHIVGGLDVLIAWLCENGYLRLDQVPHYRIPQEKPSC